MAHAVAWNSLAAPHAEKRHGNLRGADMCVSFHNVVVKSLGHENTHDAKQLGESTLSRLLVDQKKNKFSCSSLLLDRLNWCCNRRGSGGTIRGRWCGGCCGRRVRLSGGRGRRVGSLSCRVRTGGRGGSGGRGGHYERSPVGGETAAPGLADGGTTAGSNDG